MKNFTQKQRVIKRLLDTGKISRNECLRVFISRLGAIICDLTKEGWEFDTANVNGDYVYTLKNSPHKKIVYKLADGRELYVTEKTCTQLK